MEGNSLDISSAIQNPKLGIDVYNSEMIISNEYAAVSKDSAINSLRDSSCSSDEETIIRVNKRVQIFSESDSGTDKENAEQNQITSDDNADNGTDNNPKKCTIKYTLDRLDCDSDSGECQTMKNEGQQSRTESKRNKIKEKFRNLKSKHKNDSDEDSHDESNKNSEDSDADISSVAKIKQKIKERLLFKPSICDPDTSDDDEYKETHQKKQNPKQKKQHKSILTSPKPMRISAKQAMENMHKIKSESNRLLREKEVSLPYHRPKALSLKDILNRRKPACTIDGKVLPIKMNEEQLKEYALLLEQRQKEMMELCKSDTDEENDAKQAENDNTTKDAIVTEDGKDLKDLENQLLENDIIKKIEIEALVATINTSKEEPVDQNLTHDKKDCKEVENCDMSANMEILQEESEKVIELNNYDAIIDNHSAKDLTIYKESPVVTEDNSEKQLFGVECKKDSQLISLYYDSEKSDMNIHTCENIKGINIDRNEEFDKHVISEDDIDFDDIDKIIENSEIIEDRNPNSAALHKESSALNIKPKLTGAAGMVIDLDDNEMPKKLTGLELLKERFTYFARLKTPEELERERERRVPPGTQHMKLKHELEEKIAEQRSIEWAKRFEEEKQQQLELKALRGDLSDVEDDIEKIEAKLEENYIEAEVSSSSEEEEEELEEISEIKENIRKRNPMIDDEAEVTDCDDEDLNNEENNDNNEVDDINDEGNNEEDENKSSDDSSDNESSESENEQPTQKKGRILKAFVEDSDDESINDKVINIAESTNNLEEKEPSIVNESRKDYENISISQKESEVIKDSQDDPIQLAQRVNSVSDDLFTSQESGVLANNCEEIYPGTQTFSILGSKLSEESMKINDTHKLKNTNNTQSYDFSLNNAASESQTYTENFVPSQITKNVCPSQSQPFGEDILALCTGKFYDNEFITQANTNLITDNGTSQTFINNITDKSYLPKESELTNSVGIKNDDGNVLQSILEELHHSELDSQKPNKYFISKEDDFINNTSAKKKLVIDSDEEDNDTSSKERKIKEKNVKKRKPENRVLQISDDEDDEQYYEEEPSDVDDEIGERIVEYDSEENEIEVKPQNTKKKRKVEDFFEDEAELTSEDEWVGSGDEDEADLDRMEREEGDNDVFHQGKLQKELGQIHMRDVLDQDKREVRLIQELLFEDGDLGDGHRQRKFRWKNAVGDEETGMLVEGFTDTQEEEFESEELWRKQRHEREVFLRQMENQEDSAENVNVSLNRTTIIKANLSSKTMSSLLLEVNTSSTEKTEITDVSVSREKKTATNVTSPKKGFTIFQQNYHKSLLTRGQGSLARLAALATPLAIDDDTPKINSLGPANSRNFVFASLTPDDKQTKIREVISKLSHGSFAPIFIDPCRVVSKRKADNKVDTPRLVKKLKTDEKKLYNKNSLLNHLQV